MPCFSAVLLTLFWQGAPCRRLPVFLCTPHSILQRGHLAWKLASSSRLFGYRGWCLCNMVYPFSDRWYWAIIASQAVFKLTSLLISSRDLSSHHISSEYHALSSLFSNSNSFFSLCFFKLTFSCSVIQSLFPWGSCKSHCSLLCFSLCNRLNITACIWSQKKEFRIYWFFFLCKYFLTCILNCRLQSYVEIHLYYWKYY